VPTEYEALVEKLKETEIPFVEYEWKNRPDSTYGVVSLDFEDGSEEGDGEKIDRTWQASVDVFLSRLSERESVKSTIEGVLREVCGSCWWLNSIQYETDTRLFHYEWVCELQDNPEAEES
jgi:hypothetical protein